MKKYPRISLAMLSFMCAASVAGESFAQPILEITGKVIGLEQGQFVTLRDNAAMVRVDRRVAGDYPLSFSFSVPQGESEGVTVETQPERKICRVFDSSDGLNTKQVRVICSNAVGKLVVKRGRDADNYSKYILDGMPSDLEVKAVARIFANAVALTKDDIVVSWGDKNERYSTVPEELTKPGAVKAIDAGFDHFLALKKDGAVVAWGGNGGHGVPEELTKPGAVKAIHAGWHADLALKSDGSVVLWGGTEPLTVPDELKKPGPIKAIAGGGLNFLALREDGSVMMVWSDNDYGNRVSIPEELTKKGSVQAIAAGVLHSLALKNDGTVVGWGYMGSESAGSPEYLGLIRIPEELTVPGAVLAIGAKGYVSFALKTDGTMVIWRDLMKGEIVKEPGAVGVGFGFSGSGDFLLIHD